MGTSPKQVIIDKKARTLTLVLDLLEPAPSKSGKTLIIATTNGFAPGNTKHNDLDVMVSANCYIKPTK